MAAEVAAGVEWSTGSGDVLRAEIVQRTSTKVLVRWQTGAFESLKTSDVGSGRYRWLSARQLSEAESSPTAQDARPLWLPDEVAVATYDVMRQTARAMSAGDLAEAEQDLQSATHERVTATTPQEQLRGIERQVQLRLVRDERRRRLREKGPDRCREMPAAWIAQELDGCQSEEEARSILNEYTRSKANLLAVAAAKEMTWVSASASKADLRTLIVQSTFGAWSDRVHILGRDPRFAPHRWRKSADKPTGSNDGPSAGRPS